MVNIELLTSSTKEKVDKYSEFCIVTTMPDGQKVRGLIYDQGNTDAINQIFEIFDTRQRGAIVFGGTGSGKTLLFSMLQKVVPKNDLRFFVKRNVLEIVTEFNKSGHDIFSRFQDKNLLFDDLGTEDKGIHYGDKIEVMEKFIQLRYELYINKGLITHFTTNLTTAEILNRYGARCVSRLKEMTDIVLLGVNEHYTDRRILRNFIGLPEIIHPPKRSQEDIEWEKNYKNSMAEAKARPMAPHNGKGIGARMREQMGYWPEQHKSETTPQPEKKRPANDFISNILAEIPMNAENTDFVHDLMLVQSNPMNDYIDMVDKTKNILKKHLGDFEQFDYFMGRPVDWRNEVIEIFTKSTQAAPEQP